MGGRNDDPPNGADSGHFSTSLACSGRAGSQPRTLAPAVAIDFEIGLAILLHRPHQRSLSTTQTGPLSPQ